MLTRRSVLRGAAGAAVAAPAISTGLFAETKYPTQNIHAICGFPPGTGADIFVRWYGKMLEDRLGRAVVVENRLGAFGNIATEHVARAKPDGHTIMIGPGNSLLAAAPSLFKKLSFDPMNDFEHVTTLSKLPFLLIVSGDSPYKTAADLIAHLKAKGDKESYASVSNTGLVSSELLKANFGLKTVEVKYRDSSTMRNDLWAGHVAFVHSDPASSLALRQAGRMRALATSSRERFAAMPDIPSAAEVGIANSDVMSWWSVHVPKGTPAPIVDRLEAEFNDIVRSEEHRRFLASSGSDPFLGNREVLRDTLARELKAWPDYVKIARIEPQG